MKRKRREETITQVPRSIPVLLDVTITGQYDNWIRSASRIHEFLFNLGFDFGVEIIDIAATRPHPEIIAESDTTVIKLWSDFQYEVLEAVEGTE